MQPNDQISTAGEYSSFPNKTSGARYHNVYTVNEYFLKGKLNYTASPKSQSANSEFEGE